MELLHKDITEQIIGAAFEVHNVLGYGFLEKVYHVFSAHQISNFGELRGANINLRKSRQGCREGIGACVAEVRVP